MLFYIFVLISAFTNYACSEGTSIENIAEDDLLSLIRNEKYVIVLFTKPGCPECEKLETILLNLQEEFVDSMNAWVVKAESSYLVKLYNPAKEPALVFFRHGVPLLYDGEYNEELIQHVFSENKEPVVKELTDDTFELLTQAATGATTGDWFILFYTNECVECQRLQARWEAVGARLKTRLNVARVNTKTSSSTARRFKISEVPKFLFFRLGKMYHYNIPKYDVSSFVTFASDWYKNAKSEKVPVPKTPFDDLVQQIADGLKETGGFVTAIFLCSFAFGILIYVLWSRKIAAVSQQEERLIEKKETKTPKGETSKSK